MEIIGEVGVVYMVAFEPTLDPTKLTIGKFSHFLEIY